MTPRTPVKVDSAQVAAGGCIGFVLGFIAACVLFLISAHIQWVS